MTLAEAFQGARAQERSLLLPYLMAGVPDPESSVRLFVAMAEAGADGFEVGLPYADPLMDGPVIQRAGELALSGGITLAGAIDVAERVVSLTGLPSLVMTYMNPILRRGADVFCRGLVNAGVEGMIVADLPIDEGADLRDAAASHGLRVVPLVAPTTPPPRIEMAAATDPPFVYGVAELGVTGERTTTSGLAAALVRRIRAVTELPVGLGVGIATATQARAAAEIADAVIVGTALVRRVLESANVDEASEALREAVTDLAAAVRPRVPST